MNTIILENNVKTAEVRKHVHTTDRDSIVKTACGGSQICPHNKRKAYCKDCGGSQVCEHGRQKSRCKNCKKK